MNNTKVKNFLLYFLFLVLLNSQTDWFLFLSFLFHYWLKFLADSDRKFRKIFQIDCGPFTAFCIQPLNESLRNDKISLDFFS